MSLLLRPLTALLVCAAAVAGALQATAGAAVLPAMPAVPAALPVAVEDIPAYQPQTFCDPRDKPGVVAFGQLLTTTYLDTRVVGISRGCTSEQGTSEHKDGRALDWGVSSTNPAQVAEVHAVFSWLFATDAQGVAHAMLRRLGIMYIIWNKRIWGAWDGAWHDYSCSGVTGCHQDHVHFSFDWAGALAKTSFWTGQVAGLIPPPTYVYTSRAFPQVAYIRARDEPVTTPFLVKPGVPYRFTVSGTYRYSKAATARADAECSTADGTTWHSRTDGETSNATGLLDLWVDGHRAWWPTIGDGAGCNPTDHAYTRVLTFNTRAPLRLSINDATRADDSGSLTVMIQRV